MTTSVTLRVWRGDATGGEFRDFEVAAEEGEVVLDVVHRLQATQAGDLAVRWNCKAGKCGSCSAEINGLPRLMCMTRMNVFEPGDLITLNTQAYNTAAQRLYEWFGFRRTGERQAILRLDL